MTDDHSLIEKILDGDRQAFRWLVMRYERLVGHIVGRVIREDDEREEVCQDVFMKVYDKLDTFRMESKLSTWIATIAYRMSLNHIEKSNHQTVSLSQVRDLPGEEKSLTPMEHADLKKTLEEMIMRLPLQYRMVITLFHLKEHSHDEVCQITGMTLGTVKSNLYRGRKMLKEMLEKNKALSSYE